MPQFSVRLTEEVDECSRDSALKFVITVSDNYVSMFPVTRAVLSPGLIMEYSLDFGRLQSCRASIF